MDSQPPTPEPGTYLTYTALQTELAWHREKLASAETVLTAIVALVDQWREAGEQR